MSNSIQRKRILTAAALLFQGQGYPATTIRMIAAEVDLGASSLYNHISGKQELLHEICFTSAARFATGLQELSAFAKTAHDTLEGIIRLHVRLAYEHPETVTVFNDEWRHLEEPSLKDFLRQRRAYETGLYQLLSTGITRGELLPVDLEVALPSLLSSLSWIYQSRRPAIRDVDKLTQQLTALWASGWLVSSD